MNDMPSLLPVARLAPGEVLSFLPQPAALVLSPAPAPMQSFEIENGNLVIVGRGHPTDLACQLILENARDWRKLDRLSRRFADSLPEPAVSPRRGR